MAPAKKRFQFLIGIINPEEKEWEIQFPWEFQFLIGIINPW